MVFKRYVRVRAWVRACVCVCPRATEHTWRLEDNLQESVLFFHHVDAWIPNPGRSSDWEARAFTC